MVERTESELKEKLEYALQLFYDDVLEKKDLRHFFFGMELKRIIEDYICTTLCHANRRVLQRKFDATAPPEIRQAPQFDEYFVSFSQYRIDPYF